MYVRLQGTTNRICRSTMNAVTSSITLALHSASPAQTAKGVTEPARLQPFARFAASYSRTYPVATARTARPMFA